ncbi:MAG: hypothetical protein EKK54_11790 [Neisseriaceae bacterium]|nr:MAG: hypothetical protein EKK54_11790 [Neisseriaceae bacterium]
MKTKISLSTTLRPISLGLMLISIISCTSGSGSSNSQMNSANVGSQAAQTSCFTLTNGANATAGSQWWITTTATLKNTCSTAQSLTGTIITISNAKQAMNGSDFNLNTISPWSSGNAVSFSYPNNTVVATITAGPTIDAGNSVTVSFGGKAGTASAPEANSFVTTIGALPSPTPSPTPTVSPTPTPQPQPTAVPTTPPIPTGSVVSSGRVFYHLPSVPLNSSAGLKVDDGDDLNLSGDRYTDLILSNIIAGSMQVYLIDKTYPNMGYNSDYMHGMVLAQLLQENLQTSAYESNTNLISPVSLVEANQDKGVMGTGQGGPYQINSYAWSQVGGSEGYALINYVALQKNIGFTLATASAQALAPTPKSFNNKYYGPMLVAFWHYNDIRGLVTMANTPYTQAPAPKIEQCLSNLQGVTNAPLDVALGYAYNAGYMGGGLVTNAFGLCASDITSFNTTYNNYANSAGSSYNNYPYQTRFYLDEIYGNAQGIDPNNHLAVNMTNLGNIFSNVMQTLAYVNSQESYVYFTADQATNAYNKALTQTKVSPSYVYDLSDSAQRYYIFLVLSKAIANLEAITGSDFTKVTLTQLDNVGGGGGTGNVCPTTAPVYSSSVTNYTTDSIVRASSSDPTLYKCAIPGWCNNNSKVGVSTYAPGSGTHWNLAWTIYSCK